MVSAVGTAAPTLFFVFLFLLSVAGVVVMSILTAKKSRLFIIGIVAFALLAAACLIYAALVLILVSGIK